MRFQEFTDKWHITTLGECSTSLDYGLGASAIEYDGIHKYIRITDISETTNQFISKNLTSPSYFNDNYKVKQNDILFARTGASVGKTYYYNSNDGNLYYAGFLIAAHIIKEVDSKFVFYNTLSKNYNKWVKIMSARSGQPGINAEEYGSYNFYIPKLDEQNKISFLMEKIDRRIQTQSKIIKAYSFLIKGLEDKLFWNNDIHQHTYKISNILSERTEKSTIQNQYPILSSTKKGVFLQSDYFNKEAASSNNIGYKITRIGDIIISPQNLWMGNITFNNKFINGLVSPSYHVYKINVNFNSIYVARLLQTNKALFMYNTISEQGASVVRRNLNVNAFNNLSFPIPDISKQDKIGLFLNKFHQLISIEKAILKQYTNQKKYLLNNMFI